MQRLLQVLFFATILIFLGYFFTHGFNSYDEGWFAYQGQRFIQGQVPYKDFEAIYTPGTIYVTALSFITLGQSILSERIFAFVNAILAILFLYLIGKELKVPKYINYLSILLYAAWGPSHINFLWPVMLSITAGFACLYFLLRSQNEKYNNKLLFLAGLCGGLALLFKQNFGVAMVFISILFFAFDQQSRKRKTILFYLGGFLFPLFLEFIYLISTNSLSYFFQSMYEISFNRILRGGFLASSLPWDYPSSLLSKLFKFFAYLSPALISTVPLILCFKKNKKLIFLSVLSLSFYILGIRPTTDIIHLAPLISMTGVSLLLVYKLDKKFPDKMGLF